MLHEYSPYAVRLVITDFGSEAESNTTQTLSKTKSLNKNSPVKFQAIGSEDRLHFSTPVVVKKKDQVIANVTIPMKEPRADKIGTNAPAASIIATANSTIPRKKASPLIPRIDSQEIKG